MIDTQLDVLQNYLLNFGIELFGPEGGRDFSRWFPDHSQLFGHAQMAIGTASSFLANAAIILFLGMLFAFSPQLYRESIVLLVRPSYRMRVRDVLNEMGTVLQLWFVGQVARIVAHDDLRLDRPLSHRASRRLPARRTGGPVELHSLSRTDRRGDTDRTGGHAAWTIDADLVRRHLHRRAIDRRLIVGPLILRQAVDIPPAWILVAIVLLGSLFGVMGIALAVPLIAIGRVAILRFYVEDYLGDKPIQGPEAQGAGAAQPLSMPGRP